MDYSAARVDIIRIRRKLFLWACVPLAVIIVVIWAAPNSRAGLVPGLVCWMIALWWLFCLYKLSVSVDQKAVAAWAIIALQIIPVVGLVLVFSLARKAARIVRPAEVADQRAP